MKLGRLGPEGLEQPVAYDGRYLDLRPVTAEIDGAFLSSGGLDRIREALDAGTLPDLDGADELRVGPPIARPGAVLCIGLNYIAHAAESGAQQPEHPVLFLKPPNTVVGPSDRVTIPRGSSKTDWEVELGVVIGARASYLDSPADSLAHVAGFVLANDLSERAFQLEVSGGQWSKGKSARGFSPLGPWLVTPDEVEHGKLAMRSWVNGEPRQESNTADMIFGVEHLIHDLSQYLTLDPGDVILTGTPEGIALSGRFDYLRAGDVVELEIDGLGRQRQRLA
jgi:2,4-didehydro-3-deoxy-L-rhamnonate hydrolase